MQAATIDEALRSNSFISKVFGGVKSQDTVGEIKKDQIIIFNTADEDEGE